MLVNTFLHFPFNFQIPVKMSPQQTTANSPAGYFPKPGRDLAQILSLLSSTPQGFISSRNSDAWGSTCSLSFSSQGGPIKNTRILKSKPFADWLPFCFKSLKVRYS